MGRITDLKQNPLWLPDFVSDELEAQFCEHIEFATEKNRWDEMKKCVENKSSKDLEKAYDNTKNHVLSHGIKKGIVEAVMLCAAIDNEMNKRLEQEIFNV